MVFDWPFQMAAESSNNCALFLGRCFGSLGTANPGELFFERHGHHLRHAHPCFIGRAPGKSVGFGIFDIKPILLSGRATFLSSQRFEEVHEHAVAGYVAEGGGGGRFPGANPKE